MQIIDVKAHPIAGDPETYPPASHESWADRPPSSWERLIELMDEAGISKTVLVQSTSTYGYDNRYAAGGPKAYPDRFAWVGSVDVQAADAGDQMRRWAREWGMAGLRMGSNTRRDGSSWLASPETDRVWAAAVELDIPVGVLNIGEPGLLQVEDVVKRFPALTLVLDHLISPPLNHDPSKEIVETFFGLARYPNIFVQLTGVEFAAQNRAVLDRHLDRAVETFGTDRLVWGSNFPTSPGPTKALLDAALDRMSFLPEADRERVFLRNALRLYPVLA